MQKGLKGYAVGLVVGMEAKGGVDATWFPVFKAGFTEMGRPVEDCVWGVLSGFRLIHMKVFIPLTQSGHHKSSHGWLDR